MKKGVVKSYVKELGGRIEADDGGEDVGFSDRVIVPINAAVGQGVLVEYDLFAGKRRGLWAKRVCPV